MDKKKKMWLIIGGIVLVIVVVIVWLRSKSEPETTNKSAAASDPFKQLVADKMNYIKSDPEWNAEIKRKFPINKITYQQQLAIDAIWALKTDGDIPMDTYGAGVDGQVDYVKANY